jgi:hypothetical protein
VIRLSAFLAVFLLAANCALADPARIARRLEPSIVHIEVRLEEKHLSGSGFVISRDGHIATNFHVVEPHVKVGAKLTVWLPGDPQKKRRQATLVKAWPRLDLAVLKVEGENLATAPLSRDVIQRPAKGEQIYAIGYPAVGGEIVGGLETSITSGIVSRRPVGNWTATGPGFPIIQHTAPSNPGNSGGPIVNACGQVVGVNTRREIAYVLLPGGMPMMTDTIQGVFFASHVSVLVEKLNELGVPLPPGGGRCRAVTTVTTTHLWIWILAGVAGLLLLVVLGWLVIRRGAGPMIILVRLGSGLRNGSRALGHMFRRRQ